MGNLRWVPQNGFCPISTEHESSQKKRITKKIIRAAYFFFIKFLSSSKQKEATAKWKSPFLRLTPHNQEKSFQKFYFIYLRFRPFQATFRFLTPGYANFLRFSPISLYKIKIRKLLGIAWNAKKWNKIYENFLPGYVQYWSLLGTWSQKWRFSFWI